MGSYQGCKVFTVQTLLGTEESFYDTAYGVAGFSPRADGAVDVSGRKQLERICRTISRLTVSGKRLSLTRQGKVHHELETPYRDGRTHKFSSLLNFIAKLDELIN